MFYAKSLIFLFWERRGLLLDGWGGVQVDFMYKVEILCRRWIGFGCSDCFVARRQYGLGLEGGL